MSNRPYNYHAPIKGFDGTEFAFLSNFFPSTVWYEGLEFPTVEHAFQAAKTLDVFRRVEIQKAATPGKAKRLGRKVEMRSDWEEIKDLVMLNLLTQKFSIPHLKSALLATETAFLEETNTWGDQYWGVCEGKGLNHLGKLLMVVRSWLGPHKMSEWQRTGGTM